MPARVLLIEDNHTDAQEILDRLEWCGYAVQCMFSGADGLEAARSTLPDVIVLDIRLSTPQEGYHILRSIKADPATCDIPIVVFSITAHEIENRARQFGLGATWCLPKDKNLAELETVVRIALRSNSQRTRRSRARLEPLDFDSKAGVVWIDGKSTAIELTLLQAKLLAFLVDHSGEICSRDEIASSVYGAFTSNEAIDRLVSRLRDKLNDNPKKPRFIDSVRGVGYRLITKE